MKTIKVMGHSDDIVSISGDDELGDEIDCYDKGVALVFSEGTELEIKYDNEGFWRIEVIKEGNKSKITKIEATDIDYDYSDTVIVEGDITRIYKTTI